MDFYINTKAIILHAIGKDSRRYLNARLSNDIKTLEAGQTRYAAALSPQGKAEGYFSVTCISNEEFILSCDGGNSEDVIKAFKRYIVADRIEVKDFSESHKLFCVYSENKFTPALDGLIYFNSRRHKFGSIDIICPPDGVAALKSSLITSGVPEISEDEFRLRAIKACIPAFPYELNSDVIFSASGLDYAVSFKKGCYVGQEVIEKIDAYGRVPYLLKAVSVKGKLGDIKEVKADGQLLSNDKILPHFYDKNDDSTYLFLELKNRDNILDYKISINDNDAQILC